MIRPRLADDLHCNAVCKLDQAMNGGGLRQRADAKLRRPEIVEHCLHAAEVIGMAVREGHNLQP